MHWLLEGKKLNFRKMVRYGVNIKNYMTMVFVFFQN